MIIAPTRCISSCEYCCQFCILTLRITFIYMKYFSYYTFLFFLIATLVFPGFVGAVGQSVNIKNENTSIESKNRIRTLKEILYSTAMSFDYSRLAIVIDGLQKEPRGRMKNAQISLSPYIVRDTEFTKLFVHELAHYIDIYTFVADRNNHDISDNFYHISWQKPNVK